MSALKSVCVHKQSNCKPAPLGTERSVDVPATDQLAGCSPVGFVSVGASAELALDLDVALHALTFNILS